MFNTHLPPSLVGDEISFMFAVFGLGMVHLLCLEWLWRLGWSFVEAPAGLRTPLTVYRALQCSMLLAMLMRGVPDLILLMRWPEISGSARMAIANFDHRLDGWALIPFSLAWMMGRMSENVTHHQLGREPIPVHLWPSWDQLRRPLQIAAGVLAIAASLTFLQ